MLVGEGERLADLRRMLGADRSGIRYEYLGAIAPNGDTGDLAVLGGFGAVPRVLREHDVHELIVTAVITASASCSSSSRRRIDSA